MNETDKILRGENYDKCPFHCEGCGMTEKLTRLQFENDSLREALEMIRPVPELMLAMQSVRNLDEILLFCDKALKDKL